MSTFIRSLRLFLHQPDRSKRTIGYLSQYGDILRVSFDDNYIQDIARPLLSLSYRGGDEARTRAILQADRDHRLVSHRKLPPYFANLLPEGHNRDRLAAQRNCEVDDEFELLAAAGHDLMGALEVEPVSAQTGIPEAVKLWHTALGLDVLTSALIATPVEDAASLPGVVTKFSAIYDGRRYVVKKHGAAGEYILKLPTTRHPDLVENEFFGYQLCEALGLTCAQAFIIPRTAAALPEEVPFEHVLAVPRFDRGPNGLRIHMEEFAQVLGVPPQHKYGKGISDYASLFRILDVLSANRVQDLRECIGRFVAFILLGNTDAHLKNWALLYPDAHAPVLSPLYDPVCVAAFFDSVRPQEYAINRAIDAKLRTFTWSDLEALLHSAKLLRIPNHIRLAKALVKQAQQTWPALLKDAPESVRRVVMARLKGGMALTQ
jgi:serine/threonine-protein kinase HipA